MVDDVKVNRNPALVSKVLPHAVAMQLFYAAQEPPHLRIEAVEVAERFAKVAYPGFFYTPEQVSARSRAYAQALEEKRRQAILERRAAYEQRVAKGKGRGALNAAIQICL